MISMVVVLATVVNVGAGAVVLVVLVVVLIAVSFGPIAVVVVADTTAVLGAEVAVVTNGTVVEISGESAG